MAADGGVSDLNVIPMKITGIRSHPMTVPLRTAFRVGTLAITAASILVVEVTTDEGVIGLATVHRSPMQTVAKLLDALQSIVTGMDPMLHEAVWARVFAITTATSDPTLRPNSVLLGEHNRGHLLSALAAIDIALWDIKGKALGLPVWKLLGSSRREIPAYVTGGYYRDDRPSDAIGDECAGYIAQGYAAVEDQGWRGLRRRGYAPRCAGTPRDRRRRRPHGRCQRRLLSDRGGDRGARVRTVQSGVV